MDTGLTRPTPWGKLLGRSQPPRQRLDTILSTPGAANLVPRISVEDFYYLIKDLGVEDSAELLGLASAQQIRGCLDFDVWERDQVVSSRLLRWLRILSGELLPAHFARAAHAIDLELLALLYARFCRIYDQTLGEGPPEDSDLTRHNTPDTFYVIEIDAEPETAQVLEQILDRLYAADASLGRRLVLEAKWGLPSELEESSYRWRSGRMSDLGFIEYFEAVEVYRPLDPYVEREAGRSGPRPVATCQDDTVVLPAVFASSFDSDTFFSRTLEGLEDTSLVENLGAALLALLNRILAADRIDPADIDGVRQTIARAHDTLSLGLEFLADGDLDRSVQVLTEYTLTRIFRVGFSLTVDLSRSARRIAVSPEQEALLEPLLRARPLLPRIMDDPPQSGERPFRTRKDLQRARDFLAGLE